MKKNKIVYIGDNLSGLDNIENNTIGICYIDPPYNTGNKFSYNDNVNKEVWKEDIDKRLKKIKLKLVKNGVVLFSISEESLFDAYSLLKDNFKFVFEPLIWQTKNGLNQNKVTNISAINHEYILVASDEKIKTNLEKVVDKNILEQKQKNYQISIVLTKDIDKYPYKIINGKKIRIIKKGDYQIDKDNNFQNSYKNHRYQKRTAQEGHGSYRYIEYTKEIKGNKDTLYFIEGVKDKQGLGGKFILGNSYFQSITKNIELKMPSLLGFYQAGINGFQTAKPIELLKRIIKNFNIYDDNNYILDLYSGSGNVLKAIDNLNLGFYGFELGGIDNKSLNALIDNTKEIKDIEIIYKKNKDSN